MKLNTAADVKRALAIATALEMIDTEATFWNSPSGKPPIGEVCPITKRQTQRWAVARINRHGERTNSWLSFERASDVTLHGDDTFTVSGNRYRVYT